MTTVAHGEDKRLHRMLVAELAAGGCFIRAPLRSAVYGSAILAGYAGAYAVLLTEPPLAVRFAAAVLLAFLCVRSAFLAHEAGHGAVTKDRRAAALLGQVFDTLLTGLSYSYYQRTHHAHHQHCNERARDPDMQSEIFALYTESARAKRGFARLVTRHQAIFIWILVWLQGLTFKLDSLRFVSRNPRATATDAIALATHYTAWLLPPVLCLGWPDAVLNYALMTLFIGGYTGVLFFVNHIGTRVVEPEDSLPLLRHQLAVTRNLGDSRIEDFVFGGLNNHIEHHLFPSIPTARLRSARRITRDFCRRHGITYRETTWPAAVREVTRHLKSMSARAAA